LLATGLRVAWVLKVPTIAVGDFAMYRESANYLAEHGRLDSGFIYMPGLVLLLAAVHALGGEILAAKLLGALFGGLAAAPLYVLTAHMMLAVAPARHPKTTEVAAKRRWMAFTASPAAFAATVLYAVWPAGIALSSVVGTDVPAGALLLLAFALLFAWGRDHPLRAAVAFGATMGLAAYFRAVALPLGVLSAGYWWSMRANARAVVTRTALGLGVTLFVLSPWAIRNLRSNGELSFTDSHGGITALMGNYPNSEGTYARSLSMMFRDLEGGRSFLSEPHRQTDQIAYAMAKRWIAFQPGWTAGMMALRIERLFAQERGLLYWSVYRPGVLPRHVADWFGVWRPDVTGWVDGYYLVFVALVAVGIGFAITERRWAMAVPIACGLTLVATYALFVAEPRYRVTTEMLLFPAAGFGLARLLRLSWRLGAGVTTALARRGPWRAALPPVGDRQGLALSALIAVGVALAGALVVVGGQALRDRYRWAVTLWHVDGRPQMALWRRAPGQRGPSPVHGIAGGAELVLAPGQTEATAEVVLPEARAMDAAEWAATLVWRADTDLPVRLSLDGVDLPDRTGPARIALPARGDQPFRFTLRLAPAATSSAGAAVTSSDVSLTTKRP